MKNDMNRRSVIMAAVMLLLRILPAGGQTVALSTDLVEYLNFATLNIEASYPVSRHWSVNAGVKYNPFTFDLGKGKENARNRQQCYAVGARFWPWHVFSGWWMAGKVQYQEYNHGGIISARTSEGDRFGAGLSGGYSYMLGKNLNVEFGLGIWGGLDRYAVYSCPVCGLTESAGQKFFVLPSEILIALSYVF